MMWVTHIWWWFQHFSGMDNVSGRAYGFWSGFGSDIGEAAIVGGISRLLWKSIKNHEEHMNELKRLNRKANK